MTYVTPKAKLNERQERPIDKQSNSTHPERIFLQTSFYVKSSGTFLLHKAVTYFNRNKTDSGIPGCHNSFSGAELHFVLCKGVSSEHIPKIMIALQT